MEQMELNFKQKISNDYCCKKCDYYTNRKSNLLNHLNSAKHQKEICKNSFKQQNSIKTYVCDICNKIYQTSSGLWKHKKTCIDNEYIEIENKYSSLNR
jgi:DNA-binding NarL/FixJ family response regulator